MDCSALLQAAAAAEAPYHHTSSFGHPEPPTLIVHQVLDDSTVLLCACFTWHTVFVQFPDTPVLLAEWGTDNERIVDVVIVSETNNNNNANNETIRDSETANNLEIQTNPHVAVLIGTTVQLYAVELEFELDSNKWQICEFHDTHTSVFEVFDTHHEWFQPGGVQKLQTTINNNELWIHYQNHISIQLHPSAVFPSNWERSSGLDLSVEDYCGPLTKCQIVVEDNTTMHHAHIMGLPLAARAGPSSQPSIGVLGYGSSAGGSLPLLTFYSSSSTTTGFSQPTASSASRSQQGKLSSFSQTILGTAMGALRWGLGAARPDDDEQSRVSSVSHSEAAPHDDDERQTAPFPSLYREPVIVRPDVQHHDVPRTLEHMTVCGTLAAGADGLGRILLVDVVTKQLIRLWKGYRDARCYWMRAPINNNDNKLCLIIHSRQRRLVEIWKMRHGDKVASIAVGRDAKIIPTNNAHRCYLLDSNVPGHNNNRLELLQILHNTAALRERTVDPSVSTNHTPTKKAALRLQHLQQLLSTANVHSSTDDVRNALMEIKSLADLSTALDLLAVSGSVLEDHLGVQGTAFHKDAISYCRGVLNAAVHRGKGLSEVMRANLHVQSLSHKIEYHTMIVKAYDILYKFEKTTFNSNNQQQSKTPSHWAAEAMAWASTYEQVTGTSLDASLERRGKKVLKFFEFAACFTFPEVPEKAKPATRVYFSDSSRTRREILEHVFRPLLADVFSFNIVYAVFDALGTRPDCDYVQKCFGEWFMTLSVKEAYSKGLHCENPPMIRLLQDLVTRQLASGPLADHDIALNVVYKYCTECTDLVRAFMLGALCLEAVSRSAMQKEKWTYGKIKGTKLINDWKGLLRRLRVCLLVSLRMNGTKLVAPVTIDNVAQPDIFSVYRWVATDELSMTHNHEEILSLERACEMSSYSFDPSTEDGDGPSRFKVLQNSCLSAAIDETQKSEYLVDSKDDDKMGALLLFLRRFNDPELLAAHRALVLATRWTTQYQEIECLRDAMMALKSLQKNTRGDWLTASVALEVWRNNLRPIFRAHLFGFHDLHGIDEEALTPLLQQAEWFTALGRVGLQVLAMLRECHLEKKPDKLTESKTQEDSGSSWPPLRADTVLEMLATRVPHDVIESAVDAHSVVICALLVSGDIKRLVECVPSIYDLFTQSALFEPVATTQDVHDLQEYYLNDAVFSFAKRFAGPPLDTFDFGEIETLARVWNFDLKAVRTLFLLAMYELGKDNLIDDLVTKSSTQIDVPGFVEAGVNIACRRLDFVLSGRRRKRSLRDAMGLLDADTCEWIKQRVSESRPLIENGAKAEEVNMEGTHLLVMRLLSLSASSEVKSTMRVKIHSLVVLSGILAKALAND